MSMKSVWSKTVLGRGGIDWQSMVWIAIVQSQWVYWDLSSKSEYTLSVSTQQLLHELDAPLDIVCSRLNTQV